MLRWDMFLDFPQDKTDIMRKIIKGKQNSPELKKLFVNQILREDIFEILDLCCTVIFYPFEDDDNDGFHKSMPVSYQDVPAHFVFLNTAKPREKQVFTAAHELGHIWEVEKAIWDPELEKLLPQSPDNIESAMNRFAAELLMPAALFKKSATTQLSQYKHKNGNILFTDALRVIASLMNEFCVPAQAVVRRFYETGSTDRSFCEQLFSGPEHLLSDKYEKLFLTTLTDCIQEGGYTRLQQPTQKKGIKDFPLMLNELGKKGFFSAECIQSLRTTLSIPVIPENNEKFELHDTASQ